MKRIFVNSYSLPFFLLSIFLFAILILEGMVSDWGRLSGSLGNLTEFIQESLWPPDWSVVEPQAYPVSVSYTHLRAHETREERLLRGLG